MPELTFEQAAKLFPNEIATYRIYNDQDQLVQTGKFVWFSTDNDQSFQTIPDTPITLPPKWSVQFELPLSGLTVTSTT